MRGKDQRKEGRRPKYREVNHNKDKDRNTNRNHRGRGERAADVRELTGEDGRSMAADIRDRWSVPAVSQRSVRGEANTSGVEVGVTCCSRQNLDAGTETLSK